MQFYCTLVCFEAAELQPEGHKGRLEMENELLLFVYLYICIRWNKLLGHLISLKSLFLVLKSSLLGNFYC